MNVIEDILDELIPDRMKDEVWNNGILTLANPLIIMG